MNYSLGVVLVLKTISRQERVRGKQSKRRYKKVFKGYFRKIHFRACFRLAVAPVDVEHREPAENLSSALFMPSCFSTTKDFA